jgi:uncharacterized protein
VNGLGPLPSFAAWRLHGAHDGFEVARFTAGPNGTVLGGTSIGVEDGVPWDVRYRIDVDAGWRVRSAEIHTPDRGIVVQRTDHGWLVDGAARPDLDDAGDLDLEGSLVTNTLPLHRLTLYTGVLTPAPAAYVRASNLQVELLEQTYRRLDRPGIHLEYSSPRFGYREVLRFAPDGLIEEYPGIGTRTA